ncbi:matrixin family metalloprotease [Nitrosopumilus sp.]|uniref:matrixin family metalloprotease n=1 Tax=Nitrosopumilus sp. TaxID=2024843 RepID=UPI002608611A|nr:matrixin family metalloprotease [Nitrosopumilus sp.]
MSDNKDSRQNVNEKQKELLQNATLRHLIKHNLKKGQNTKLIIVCLAIVGSLGTVGFFTFSNNDVVQNEPEHMKTMLRVQNLRGDTVSTWAAWKILEEDLFHVHVVDSAYATKERQDAILDTIMSLEKIEIDDSLLHKGPKGTTSTYYMGWYGALNSINNTTLHPIPKNLHFHVTDKGEGDILIELNNMPHPEGISGYTTTVIDENSHQILKAHITIYNVEKLSMPQLKTIVRHELGHGFGLGHSTAPEDLMAPQITTAYPYISECALDTIEALYNDLGTDEVMCKK